MTMNPDHVVTSRDVGEAILWVGGGLIGIVLLIALFVFLVNILNPFSSGH